MIVEIARDPRELERALHHPKRRVTVAIQDAIAERAVIGADAHCDAALFAELHQRPEPGTNAAQLRGILLIRVFTDDEFL